MAERVVIIGGSIAGLGAAIGLAQEGFHVTVVERELGPDTDDGDEAFQSWDRRHVPQFRQGHIFQARARNVLHQHAAEVVEWLANDGIETVNFFKLLAPPELWTPADDDFDSLLTRRPAFELALRRVAEAEPGVVFRCPASAADLLFVDGEIVTVRGVRLDDGSELPAEVVLDCSGRRTSVPRWLARAGASITEDSQDCGITYFSRYFRLAPGSAMPMFAILGVNQEIPKAMQVIGFPGDKGAFGVCLAPRAGDEELRVLRHNWAWEAAANAVPSVHPWIGPLNAFPITDVEVMTGHRNIRRHYVNDGEPLVLGLLAVGDSLCTTNPTYGWGASMALTYAFSAVEALTAHPGDLRGAALAYEESVAPEADAVYRESAAMDRARIYRWEGLAVPDGDREEVERQDLIGRGVGYGATRDPVLGRAFLRRSNLLDRPDAVLDDPEVVARATAMRTRLEERTAERPGPTREDILAAIAAAGAPIAEV
jgi:2-polyprenyl-6-methoxyphenol hydroxylase-like FAD-dependent oxidoreductase